MPFISFIIPTYNMPHSLLQACVDSILALNLQPEERQIIIVDDGSETPAAKWIQQNYDRVVECVTIPHSGLSEARNEGLRHATGLYVQFVDADDELLTNAYNHCVALLRKIQPDILHFNYTHRKLDRGKFDKVQLYDYGADRMLADNLGVGSCSYIFRRVISSGLRFRKGSFHEDEEFTPLLFLRAKKTVEVPCSSYYYRPRESSITHSYTKDDVEKRLSDFFSIICHLQSLLNHIRQQTNGTVEGVEINDRNSKALERRIAQATMDYLINVVRLRKQEKRDCSHQERRKYAKSNLMSSIQQLREFRLYPLSKRYYSFKYTLFRIVANSSFLRFLLCYL